MKKAILGTGQTGPADPTVAGKPRNRPRPDPKGLSFDTCPYGRFPP